MCSRALCGSRSTSGMSGRSMKPKCASARQKFGATSLDRQPVLAGDARHRLDLDAQHEQLLMQRAVVLDVPDHDRRRVLLGAVRNTAVPGTRGILRPIHRHELLDRDQRLAHALRDRGRAGCQIHITP